MTSLSRLPALTGLSAPSGVRGLSGLTARSGLSSITGLTSQSIGNVGMAGRTGLPSLRSVPGQTSRHQFQVRPLNRWDLQPKRTLLLARDPHRSFIEISFGLLFH